MKIDRCRSFRRYTSPEAETNGSTTIVVAELRVSRIFSQVLSINRRVSLADESLLGMVMKRIFLYYKVIREGDFKMDRCWVFISRFIWWKLSNFIRTEINCGDRKYRNIGVGLFIKRYLCWMKRDGDMMKIDNFINNYTFVLIFRIDHSKVSFELFKIIIFYQRNFYRKIVWHKIIIDLILWNILFRSSIKYIL